MSKKVLAIVGLAAVIAVSTGVITFTGQQHRRGTDGDPAGGDAPSVTEAYDTPDDNEDPSDDPTETSVTVDDETQVPDDTDPGDDVNGYGDDIVSVTSYSIARIIDHTTGDEVTAREVFGKLYYYCYLAFKTDGTFELCLNPVADEVRKGSYRIYGDVISVEYSDGTGSEFNIIADNSGGIDYIVINYGDYDVYFG